MSPSFDIVRVEPSGESVVAGRAAPGATIEMLRGGASFARTLADPSGLFAFVPPALPPGTSDIALRATNPDGSRVESRQNVVVEIGQKRDTAPLVTLMSPDRPTVVLSTPEPPAPARAEASSSAPDKAPAPARAPVRIVSVDAEEGGKLYVSGQAAPGASVRLYLNDTLIAPGSAGANGQVSFAIGRGVRPGKYKVRLDDVDPVTGDVKTRAEIAFGIPEPVAIASANEAGSKTVGTGHQGSGGAPVTSPFGAPPAPPAPRAPAARAEAPGPVAAASPPAGANPARSDPPVAPAVSPPSGVAGAFRVPSTAAPTGNAAPDGASGGSGSQAPAPPASSAVVEPGTRSAGSGPSRSGTSGAAAPSPSPAPDSGSAAGLSGREARGPNSTPPGPSSSSSPSSRSSSSRSGEPAGGEARAREDRAREDRARASDNVARPLDSDPSLVVVPEIGTASVTRGDNLWSISRRIYGQGVRYTTIFGANKNQIRDPDLIYPGQLFVLPPDSPTQP